MREICPPQPDFTCRDWTRLDVCIIFSFPLQLFAACFHTDSRTVVREVREEGWDWFVWRRPTVTEVLDLDPVEFAFPRCASLVFHEVRNALADHLHVSAQAQVHPHWSEKSETLDKRWLGSSAAVLCFCTVPSRV